MSEAAHVPMRRQQGASPAQEPAKLPPTPPTVERRVVGAPTVPQPAAPYSQALEVRAGRLLFISGQVPLDAMGQLVGPGDPLAQIRQAFANVRALVVAAGGGLNSIVELTIYLRSMAHRPLVTQVRQELLAPPYPATTMVEVSRLADEAWLVEISAIAALWRC